MNHPLVCFSTLFDDNKPDTLQITPDPSGVTALISRTINRTHFK